MAIDFYVFIDVSFWLYNYMIFMVLALCFIPIVIGIHIAIAIIKYIVITYP